MRPFLTAVKRSEMSEKLFFKLVGRCVADHGGDLPEVMMVEMKEVAGAFTEAMIRAVPGLSVGQVLWKLHYTFGVMAQTLLHGDLLHKLTGGECGDPDAETQFQQMIVFCEAGFHAMEGDEK
ncbi:MAG: hypothetical protein CSA74_12820 [Rhodobacterales bacterium]|nr:MAG: hypothetical protein CSA74_12820 [Rhodobacterales bacterium]